MPEIDKNSRIYTDALFHYFNEQEAEVIDEAASKLEEHNPVLYPKDVAVSVVENLYSYQKKFLFEKGWTFKENYLKSFEKSLKNS